MRIEGYDKSAIIIYSVFYIFAIFLIIIFYYMGGHIESTLLDDAIVLLSSAGIQVMSVYNIGYKTKYYDIDGSGICETWYGFIKVKFEWSQFIIIEETYVYNKGITYADARPYKAIILSKVCIKKIDVPTGSYGYTKMIFINWIKRHPSQIIAIDLDFLKPGQYEEFWSYVPERLKGGFKTKEEIVDN